MAERAADGKIQTTQWEDIQYKHGNKVGRYATHELEICAQKLAERHIDAPLETHNRLRERLRDAAERGQRGEEVNEDLVDEDPEMAQAVLDGEDDEDEILERFRAARRREMLEQQATNCFGRVKPISGASYVQEITEASAQHIVVGVLAEHNNEGCLDLLPLMDQVAQRHMDVKFVTCKSTEAIPNFPAKHLPCVVVYRAGQLVAQLTGMEPWCRKGITKPTLETVMDNLRKLQVLPQLEESDEEADPYLLKSTKMAVKY